MNGKRSKRGYGNIHSRAYGLHVLRFWMQLAWWLQHDVVNGLFGQNSEIDAEWFENNWNWLQYREDAFYVHVNVFRQLGEEGECFWN